MPFFVAKTQNTIKGCRHGADVPCPFQAGEDPDLTEAYRVPPNQQLLSGAFGRSL